MTRSGRLLTEGLERRGGLMFAAAVMLSLVAAAWAKGTLGQIGPDGDDLMRLVQVRDLLAGQGWFDLVQARLGPDGGTPMHWSRIVDLPIIAIALVLTPFVGDTPALVISYSAWPVLSVSIVVAGLVLAARASAHAMTLPFVLVLGFAVLFQHFRFLPGAIDHHNLQLGLLMLGAGLLADPARTASRAAFAGAALALSVAVGVEVYAFVVAMTAFVAADWCIAGQPARRTAAAFGSVFAIVLVLIFFATVAPSAYGRVACDAYSGILPLAGGLGGIGLAVAAAAASGRSIAFRFGCLVAIGSACLGALLVLSPACLGNPLDALPPDVRELWLARIDEARPTLDFAAEHFAAIPLRLGTLVAGLIAACVLVMQGDSRRLFALLAVLIALALVMALYQTRFYVFGQVFAIVPLAALAAKAFHAGRAGRSRVAYLWVLAAGLPFVWYAAGSLVAPSAPPVSVAECDTDAMIDTLSGLPEGRVLTSAGLAPQILYDTPHSALYGNYHRNAAGIEAALSTFSAPSGASRALVSASGVTYIVVCPSDADMVFFVRHAPGGLIADISDGQAPSWLEPISDGPSVIYRVVPGP